MIKYIRSLMLADGLVSRLSPGMDIAPEVRRVCEDFFAEEAQAKIFSRGAALSFLADLSGWLLAGPGRMLHAMELMERRQLRLQVRSDPNSDHSDGLRTKTLTLAAVWLSAAIVLLTGWEGMAAAGPSRAEFLLIAFWGGWTIWLTKLLRRLTQH
jgi:hypothetical protein